MNQVLNSFLLIYAGLFPIVNPVGGAPIFLGLTRQCTDPERHALADLGVTEIDMPATALRLWETMRRAG